MTLSRNSRLVEPATQPFTLPVYSHWGSALESSRSADFSTSGRIHVSIPVGATLALGALTRMNGADAPLGLPSPPRAASAGSRTMTVPGAAGSMLAVYRAPLPVTVVARPLTTAMSVASKPVTGALKVIVTSNAPRATNGAEDSTATVRSACGQLVARMMKSAI